MAATFDHAATIVAGVRSDPPPVDVADGAGPADELVAFLGREP